MKPSLMLKVTGTSRPSLWSPGFHRMTCSSQLQSRDTWVRTDEWKQWKADWFLCYQQPGHRKNRLPTQTHQEIWWQNSSANWPWDHPGQMLKILSRRSSLLRLLQQWEWLILVVDKLHRLHGPDIYSATPTEWVFHGVWNPSGEHLSHSSTDALSYHPILESFSVQSGVRQGLSLIGFRTDKQRGIQRTLSKHLEALGFADDLAVLSRNTTHTDRSIHQIGPINRPRIALIIGIRLDNATQKDIQGRLGEAWSTCTRVHDV